MSTTELDLTTPWKERDRFDKADAVRHLIERQGLTTGQAAEILGTSRSAIIGIKDRANIHLPQTGILAEVRHRMVVNRQRAGQLKTFADRRAQGLPAMKPRKPKPARLRYLSITGGNTAADNGLPEESAEDSASRSRRPKYSTKAKRDRQNADQTRKTAPKPERIDGKQYAPVPDRAWQPLEGSTPKPLHEHQHGECLWPLLDHPILFCCLPAEPNHNYCPTHRALGVRIEPARAPRKETTL